MDKQAASPKGPLTYNVDFGKGQIVNLFEGLSPAEIEEMTGTQDPPEEEKGEGKQNAALEGEEKTPKPEAQGKKEEAKPKEEEAAAPAEKAAETEKPKDPEKLKFKTKYRGQEEEREYTAEQIQQNLNRLRMYDENQQEFWRQKQEVEPFWHLSKTEWFRRVLKEGQESGEIAPPPEPPATPPTIQFEVLKRKAEPDYQDVLRELREYAMTLPPQAVALLDSDPAVFLPEYDRFAKIVRDRKAASANPVNPAPQPQVDPKVAEKILAAKEKAKEAAVVEKPGTAPPEDAGAKEMAKRNKELKRRMREGDMNAAVELAMQFYPSG